MQNHLKEIFTGMIFSPKITLKKCQNISLVEAVFYYLILVSVFVCIESLIFLFNPSFISASADFRGLMKLFILFIIGWLVLGPLIYLFIHTIFQRDGIEKTFRALFLAATPLPLIGWLPIGNSLWLIWGFVLFGWGLTEYYELSCTSRFILGFLSIMLFTLFLIIWLFI
jgi:hypothetical protein